jgi:uncharacterized membrane protein YbhN (UPF0104 family)
LRWRHRPVALPRGQILALILAGALLVAALSLLLANLLLAIFAEAPAFIFLAALLLFVLAGCLRLAERASFYIRRRARRRRLRG